MKIVKYGLFLLLLLIITSTIYAQVNKWFESKTESTLMKNLPNDISKAQFEFTKRVQDNFPLGISEKELIQELESQGFQILYFDDDNRPYAYMQISSGFVCSNSWRIVWQKNKQGNITLIDGSYRGASCL